MESSKKTPSQDLVLATLLAMMEMQSQLIHIAMGVGLLIKTSKKFELLDLEKLDKVARNVVETIELIIESAPGDDNDDEDHTEYLEALSELKAALFA